MARGHHKIQHLNTRRALQYCFGLKKKDTKVQYFPLCFSCTFTGLFLSFSQEFSVHSMFQISPPRVPRRSKVQTQYAWQIRFKYCTPGVCLSSFDCPLYARRRWPQDGSWFRPRLATWSGTPCWPESTRRGACRWSAGSLCSYRRR